jgi:hypothetical protein
MSVWPYAASLSRSGRNKLSWMHLFFMKAFCHPETSSFSLGASQSARIFGKS